VKVLSADEFDGPYSGFVGKAMGFTESIRNRISEETENAATTLLLPCNWTASNDNPFISLASKAVRASLLPDVHKEAFAFNKTMDPRKLTGTDWATGALTPGTGDFDGRRLGRCEGLTILRVGIRLGNSVGASVGSSLGEPVGLMEKMEGRTVGKPEFSVGLKLGVFVGRLLGTPTGRWDGPVVGDEEGVSEGVADVGAMEGRRDGRGDGFVDGFGVGPGLNSVGSAVGSTVGSAVGSAVGKSVGNDEGSELGRWVGRWVGRLEDARIAGLSVEISLGDLEGRSLWM